MKTTLCLVGLAIAGTTWAASTPTPVTAEASIPFATQNGVRDWRARDGKGIWLQARSGQWLYARFLAPCSGIEFETSIRVLPSANGTLDKWGGISSRNTGRCSFASLVRSDPPPSRKAAKAAAGTGSAI